MRKSAFAAVAFGLVVASLGLGGCKLLKPAAKKAYGASCSSDMDCESMKCTPHGKICAKTCAYDDECKEVADTVCRQEDTSNALYCTKKENNPPGGTCQTRADCDHGECLHKVGEEDGPGICSAHCKTAADCPAHMKSCESISDSGAMKMCLPGEAGGGATAKFGSKKPGAKPGTPPPPGGAHPIKR